MRRTMVVVTASLAVAALLGALAGPAGADQPAMVAGGGSRAPAGWQSHDTFFVTLKLGGATGNVTIVRVLGTAFRPTVCRYDTFANVSISDNTATFEARGVCRGENEFGEFEFAAWNRFTIIDNGEPGVGADILDVNFLGSGGIAVPGGEIDTGDFQVWK